MVIQQIALLRAGIAVAAEAECADMPTSTEKHTSMAKTLAVFAFKGHLQVSRNDPTRTPSAIKFYAKIANGVLMAVMPSQETTLHSPVPALPVFPKTLP